MNFRTIYRSLMVVSLTVLCLFGMSWLMPVQASTNIARGDNQNLNLTSTKLETEVLEIIRSHPEAIIESLQAYQEQQKEQQKLARQAFLQKLKTDSQSIIGESPVSKSVDAKIFLVEFSDFQCPYCSKAYKTLKQFQSAHQDEVKFVYKHLPLTSIHPQAMPAAKAAWAAGQQGRFWEYHDNLFMGQDKLGESFYLDIAKNLDLDLEKFNRDRKGVLASVAIQKDIEMAQTLGVKGTPFLVINGEFLSGAVPLSVLEETLQRN